MDHLHTLWPAGVFNALHIHSLILQPQTRVDFVIRVTFTYTVGCRHPIFVAILDHECGTQSLELVKSGQTTLYSQDVNSYIVSRTGIISRT